VGTPHSTSFALSFVQTAQQPSIRSFFTYSHSQVSTFNSPSVHGKSLYFTSTVPTVAAINGHCFAAAAIIALACDYRVITDGVKRNVWMCMNEVDFGAPWPVSLAAVTRAKVPVIVARKFVLEGHRFTPAEARDADLVDEIVSGGTQGVLKRAWDIAEEKAPKAREGVWGVIKVRSSLFTHFKAGSACGF
jgi:enoyl-CoA hydratase/carnithine racemase